MSFVEAEKQGLIKTYYRCNLFTICRVADWSIMAIEVNGETHYDADSEDQYMTVRAWHIDREFANKIIKNNNVFAATMISKQTARKHDMVFSTRDCVSVLAEIKAEIHNGARQCLIDPELEKDLKGIYANSIQPYVDLYGNPPKFTERKFWAIMLAFFLYPLGLPWFLAGDKRGGFIMLATMFGGTLLSIIFMPLIFVAMAFLVINVFVFYFKLFFGKIKDEKGLPIITKKNQQHIAKLIEEYTAYKNELGE